MDKIVIRGGRRLKGRIPISGAKNAALTLMPCALLSDEPLTFRNLPRLADVDTFGHLRNQHGAPPLVEVARPAAFGWDFGRAWGRERVGQAVEAMVGGGR